MNVLSALGSGYLAFLSCYHIATGLLSYCAPETALRFYRACYGCDPQERRQLAIAMRPWGALAVFAGIMGIGALLEPGMRNWVQVGLILLLGLRVTYRIALRRELLEISGIPEKRNLFSIGFLLLGIILLAGDLLVRHIATGSAPL